MSTLRADTITNSGGTGAPVLSQGLKVGAITDASGGNTATINGVVPIAEGMVVLGTMTTTSGTSVSLTGLNLTSYKQLLFDFSGLSHGYGSSQSYFIGAAEVISGATAGDVVYGNVWLSLWNGIAVPLLTRNNSIPSGIATGGLQIAQSGYTTATTTITVSVGAVGPFDGGSIRVYGVR